MRYAVWTVLFSIPSLVMAGDEKQPRSRERWATAAITGSPEPPPPFALPRVFPGAKFERPLLWTAIPQTGQIVVGEQNGKLFAIDRTKPEAKPVLIVDLKANWKNLVPHPDANDFEFVYGIAFHPKFAENRKCYVSYTLKGKKGKKTGPFDHEKNFPEGTRVSEFVFTPGAAPKIDLTTERVIISWPQGGHNGADLHFGNDGYLYISTGDAADPNPPDPLKTGTDCSDLLSSILRIDIDKVENGQAYAIPKDNPFVGMTHQGKPVRAEIWSYGYRNPWRMSFDRPTGDLWIGDVGWEQWETIHKATRGSNHGWSCVEGRQPLNSQLDLGPTPTVTPPAIEFDHTQAASMTGGYVYRGRKFPELFGQYIFGDYMTKRIWAAKIEKGVVTHVVDLTEPTLRIVSFGLDQDNEIYLVDYDTGTLHTLERNTAPAYDPKKFPTLLSQTGLFAKTASHEPAKGVHGFLVNAEAWHDGAKAERFFAVPGDEPIVDWEGRKPLGGNIEWLPFQFHFPKDSVLGKTLSIGTPQGPRRIETQLLHYDGRYWQAYTYRWKADESDADLVPTDGDERDVEVADPRMPGGKRMMTWNFNSRAQCLTCHTPWAEVSLGFSSLNLNRTGSDGRNQLVVMCESGLLVRRKRDGQPDKPYSAESVRSLDALTNPYDGSKTLDDRARSYLHVNCSHCHRNGGGGAVSFEMTKDADLKKNIWDCPPTRGSFGINDAKVIAPGQPERSTLVYRMAKFGKDRMPHIGPERPDPQGLGMMADWIRSKPLEHATMAPPRAGTTEAALQDALTKLTRTSIEPLEREKMVQMPPGPARELFEGYLPSGERKLGQNPRPRAILSLAGDAKRGQEVFANSRNQCVSCHQIDGKGIAIGPDLSRIGKDRTREQLLQSILEPSRVVEAKYQSCTIVTLDGKTVTGIITRSDAASVTIRDATGKDHTIGKDNVELQKTSPVSLMATGLMADLTPQQAADLLEFLATRK
jgi:putative heme-binding domain-containing protein